MDHVYADEACSSPDDFHFLYDLQGPQRNPSDSLPPAPPSLQPSVPGSEFPVTYIQSTYSSLTDSCCPSPVNSSFTPFAPYPLASFTEQLPATSLAPDPTYCFQAEEKPYAKPSPSSPPARTITSRKHEGSKRRKVWSHALEKALFTPEEICTMGAPHRRTIYTASLEAHIDRLHHQLLDYSLFPIPFEKLESFRGLDSRTAKSMIAGLQHDASELWLKHLELQCTNEALRDVLRAHPGILVPPVDNPSALGRSAPPQA
ncbi:hypothetical protein SCP_1502330 [Sparassis crispa]|uniref:Uncharacterized protein n=1 Tax=Sparassis crispa TaxID=139825 RepID=A0A401H456_9APHY|nr:hypothetical protein SCP_1502330 [Sparassis crispa]GBE89225.1 hypothetical protein SCP_1502330 [Sparassis crispa]